MAEEGTLRKARDYALILLPLAYAVGFLSWSTYQAKMGLGFRTLSIPHYLVASFPVLAITGFGALLRTLFEQQDKGRKIWPWVLDALAFFFSAWLVLGLMDAVGAVGWTMSELFVWTSVITSIPVFGRVSVAALERLPFFKDEPQEGRHIHSHSSRRPSSSGWFKGDVYEVLIPSSMAFFLLVMLNGPALLGDIEQSFGGAAPRAAYLDLEPSLVEPSWQSVLFPNGTNMDAPVVRSVPVNVLHRNSDFILFRTAAEPERHDRLFDISSDVVKGIVWCGDSCDRWLPESPAPNS